MRALRVALIVLMTIIPVHKGRFLGNFLVTCYDLTGVTASGAIAGPQIVAVDPHIIPLGTHLYVQGVGRRVAGDTGGAIMGDHIDIWKSSYDACLAWGVRTRKVFEV